MNEADGLRNEIIVNLFEIVSLHKRIVCPFQGVLVGRKRF